MNIILKVISFLSGIIIFYFLFFVGAKYIFIPASAGIGSFIGNLSSGIDQVFSGSFIENNLTTIMQVLFWLFLCISIFPYIVEVCFKKDCSCMGEVQPGDKVLGCFYCKVIRYFSLLLTILFTVFILFQFEEYRLSLYGLDQYYAYMPLFFILLTCQFQNRCD